MGMFLQALEQIVPIERINHVFSCDPLVHARRFMLENCHPPPQHMYETVANLMDDTAWCWRCQGPCAAHHGETADIVVGGFPCQAFSNLRHCRFDADYEPFQTPAGKVFFEISRWICQMVKANKAPKVVLLENVQGLLHKNKSGIAPIDVVMDGVVLEGGRATPVGLRAVFSDDYVILDPMTLSSQVLGLPMVRGRIFLVMIRRDLCSDLHFHPFQSREQPSYGHVLPIRSTTGDRIVDNLHLLKARPIEIQPLEEYMDLDTPVILDTESERNELKKRARFAPDVRTRQDLDDVKEWEKQSVAFRKKYALREKRAREGRPVSSALALYGATDLSSRESDLLDCAILWCRTQYDGRVKRDLVVDLSQAVAREPWRVDGKVPCFHRGMKLWWRNSIVNVESCFHMMGWPRRSLVLADCSVCHARALLGNMLAVPVVGAILCCIMREVAVFSDTNSLPQ